MSPEKQRIAIAQACGWRCLGGHDWIAPGEPLDFRYSQELPAYCNDPASALTLCDRLASMGWNCDINQGLDKTWECTARLNDDITNSHYGPGPSFCNAVCECFLRVLNLWEDGE